MGAASLVGAFRYALPQILWGPALEHTIEVGLPVRRAETYPEPRPGFYAVELRYAQDRDTVTIGVEFRMDVELGPVPGVGMAVGPFGAPVTGFDDANGWDDFLRWSEDPYQVFHWIADRTVPAGARAVRRDGPFRSAASQPRADFRPGRMIALTLVSDDGAPLVGY